MNRISFSLPSRLVFGFGLAALVAPAVLPEALGSRAVAAENSSKNFSYEDDAKEPGVLYKRVVMGQGRSVEVDLPRDAAEIIVAAPDVANAIVRSPRRIYILALKNGQTSIIAMDREGNKIAVIQVTNGRNIEELKEIFNTAIPTSHINVRTVDDTVILTGEVDNPQDALQATDIAKAFITKATSATAAGTVVNSISIKTRDQVLVHLTIAEVQREVIKQFGLTNAQASGSWGKIVLDNPLSVNLQQLSSNSFTFGNSSLGGRLQAFERNGVGKVLAEPNVTAVSGESAKFTAGGELPIPASSSCSNNVCLMGYQYKAYGVTLNITPVVLSGGRIQLHLATEVTDIDYQHQLSAGSDTPGQLVNIPAFRTRKNETTIELPSGGSVATAGLISAESRAAVDGFPGLMQLPILGALFRSRDYLRQETELMIIATPYIVKPTTEKELPLPTRNLMDASDVQAIAMGRINRAYASPDNPEVSRNFKGKVGFIND